ncbi:MAG: tetratricopeptide repeat protein, partial [Saprospiraceae bacterium]
MAKNKPTPSRKPAAQPLKPPALSESGGYLPPSRLTHPMWGGIAVSVWAFLLYVNTLGHGWALDDAIVITDNMFTTRGVEGLGGIFSKDTFFGFFKVEGKETLVSGGRYRPLT